MKVFLNLSQVFLIRRLAVIDSAIHLALLRSARMCGGIPGGGGSLFAAAGKRLETPPVDRQASVNCLNIRRITVSLTKLSVTSICDSSTKSMTSDGSTAGPLEATLPGVFPFGVSPLAVCFSRPLFDMNEK